MNIIVTRGEKLSVTVYNSFLSKDQKQGNMVRIFNKNK